MKRVMVLEISNVTDDDIQVGLGHAFADFCRKHNGAGITASVLEDDAAKEVLAIIYEEEK